MIPANVEQYYTGIAYWHRFTLQAVEDFDREALFGGLGEESFRPGTPENGLPPDMQAIRASTPLIYTATPRQHVHLAAGLSQKAKVGM